MVSMLSLQSNIPDEEQKLGPWNNDNLTGSRVWQKPALHPAMVDRCATLEGYVPYFRGGDGVDIEEPGYCRNGGRNVR